MAKKTKKKTERAEMVLTGVLSYPDLANPKPFKGKIYYRTDVLFDQDDPQLGALKKKLTAVRTKMWGDDKAEWPKKAKKRFIQDGNEREDQPTYKDKMFVTVSTQQLVPCIDPKGRTVNPASVKGGMTAEVAVCISPWENEGDEGISIYLQAVKVDVTQERLPGFGGGKSAKAYFGMDAEEDSDDGEDHEDEEEDLPKSKKKAASKKDFMDDDEDEDEESDDDEEE